MIVLRKCNNTFCQAVLLQEAQNANKFSLFTRKTPLCILKSSDVLASVTGVYLTACPCQTTTTVVWHSSFPHSSVLSAWWLWCPFKDTTAETDLSQGSKIKASALFSQDELFMLTLWGHTDCISANTDCKQTGLFGQLTLCRVKTFLKKHTHKKSCWNQQQLFTSAVIMLFTCGLSV